MLNLFKALFRQNKPQYVETPGMTTESRTMLRILDMMPNARVEKKHFINVGVYNPGRAKSTLVNKHDKCIICNRKNNKSYRMYITNPVEARSNMTKDEKKTFTIEHLYNLHFGSK